ncbi:hypothetical protein [Cypionkella sp.]|uniref:hypothetical protein n=1 Tax=Cypionkella sp. TaxID=2811411 RepID=UPI002AB87EF1|nr:hypothetical protein [Cypionkella sp.]MDZ4395760.1 hypothetical protein [Cypionkella sp.]
MARTAATLTVSTAESLKRLLDGPRDAARHDCLRGSLCPPIVERFKATHQIRGGGRCLDDFGLPDWTAALSDLDRLMALWEWRSGPTPWLWMVKT